jgi:U3 small nucleolar RNA-associated protein 11
LQEKATFRNPNEFYYKMINSKTVDGVHIPKTGGKKHTEEKLMKMQDISHLMSKWQAEKKKLEVVVFFCSLCEGQVSSMQIYFAEDREIAKELRPLVVNYTPDDLLHFLGFLR